MTSQESAQIEAILKAPTRWSPISDPQQAALESPADELYYGGAAGGGKTDLLLGAALQHRHAIIFRREYPQLKGIEERARELYSRYGTYNGSGHIWRLNRLSNTPAIEFGAAADDRALDRYQGRPHDLVGFDEIPHFTEFQYRFLTGWLRTSTPGQRTRIIAAGNPPLDAVGEWVLDYWSPWLKAGHPNSALPGELRWFVRVDDKDVEVPNGSPVEHKGETLRPLSRTFIPARIEDNPILMLTGYKGRLQSFPEPLRSQLLLGLFNVKRDVPKRVYWSFSSENLNSAIEYDRDRPVYVSIDFNVSPATLSFSHELAWGEYPKEHHQEGIAQLGVWGEIYVEEGYDATQLAMLAITGKDRSGKRPEGLRVPDSFKGLINHNNRVIIYGDASGAQSTMASQDNRSLWAWITSAFDANMKQRYTLDVPEANPSVAESSLMVVWKLRTLAGNISLWIHPRCLGMRRDLEYNVWRNRPNGTVEIDKKDPKLTHLGDGLRYLVHRRYKAEGKQSSNPAGWERSLAANLITIPGISGGTSFPWDVR